jgi:hypothetical protein
MGLGRDLMICILPFIGLILGIVVVKQIQFDRSQDVWTGSSSEMGSYDWNSFPARINAKNMESYYNYHVQQQIRHWFARIIFTPRSSKEESYTTQNPQLDPYINTASAYRSGKPSVTDVMIFTEKCPLGSGGPRWPIQDVLIVAQELVERGFYVSFNVVNLQRSQSPRYELFSLDNFDMNDHLDAHSISIRFHLEPQKEHLVKNKCNKCNK